MHVGSNLLLLRRLDFHFTTSYAYLQPQEVCDQKRSAYVEEVLVASLYTDRASASFCRQRDFRLMLMLSFGGVPNQELP